MKKKIFCVITSIFLILAMFSCSSKTAMLIKNEGGIFIYNVKWNNHSFSIDKVPVTTYNLVPVYRDGIKDGNSADCFVSSGDADNYVYFSAFMSGYTRNFRTDEKVSGDFTLEGSTVVEYLGYDSITKGSSEISGLLPGKYLLKDIIF